MKLMVVPMRGGPKGYRKVPSASSNEGRLCKTHARTSPFRFAWFPSAAAKAIAPASSMRLLLQQGKGKVN